MLPKRPFNFKKITAICLGALLLVLIVLYQLGHWLIDVDAPQKADVIFLLMGSEGDRSLLAIDLVKSGYANRIIMAEPLNDQRRLLLKHGIYERSDTQRVIDLLVQKGIMPELVLVLKGATASTIEEATAAAGYCRSHPGIKNVSVVTSTYHTARARMIFNRVFASKGISAKIIIPFNKYTPYNANNWFERPSDRRETYIETSKLIYYLCFSRWKI
jgi:uncharacterized SAM-binding protein YcdF (DUF218 family)